MCTLMFMHVPWNAHYVYVCRCVPWPECYVYLYCVLMLGCLCYDLFMGLCGTNVGAHVSLCVYVCVCILVLWFAYVSLHACEGHRKQDQMINLVLLVSQFTYQKSHLASPSSKTLLN